MNIKNYKTIIKSSYAVLMAWGLLCLCPCMLTSCSEADDTVNEYENWQQRNETFFAARYQEAKDSIAAGKSNWQLVRVFSKMSDDICSPTDYVIVHKATPAADSGAAQYSTTGETPEYTDSVQLHYRGRLMPSVSYPDGFQFDATWYGEYDLNSMIPQNMKVAGLVVGLSSAIMQMHVGERWEVCIPYRLGYNTADIVDIPPYSTLIFDVTLHAIGKPGSVLPAVR